MKRFLNRGALRCGFSTDRWTLVRLPTRETILPSSYQIGVLSLPVVALTAQTTEEYRAQCFAQGMQGFLAKPIQAKELLETVAKASQRRKSRD